MMSRATWRLMIRTILPITGLLLTLAGCVKDYDFDKLSSQARLQPHLILPVVYGSMTVEDMVEPNDTVVFDPDGAVRIVYREDSIFYKSLDDIVDLTDQPADSVDFSLEPYALSNVSGTADLPNRVGSVDLTPLDSFTWVRLSHGYIDVTIRNNLSVTITSLTVRLKNTADGSQVGSDLTFSNLASGAVQTLTMDVTGERMTNELTFEIVSIAPTVAEQSDAFTVTLSTREMEASEGNAILPDQMLYGDTGIYRLEEDTLQITQLELEKGIFDIIVSTNFPEEVDLEIIFPSARDPQGDTLRYFYTIHGNTLQDSIVLDGARFDLTTDVTQPYNAMPYAYKVLMKASGNYVDFSAADVFHFKYKLRDMELGYAEGYFGEQEYTFDQDTIDTGLEDLFSKIHGTLELTDPRVSILYRNGFGLPVSITADIEGISIEGDRQALNAAPVEMLYPPDRDAPPVEGSLDYTRDNSDIVELVALRPVTILYGGNARLNPDGFQGWTNFVTGKSGIVADLEVEVPLEFRMQDLWLQDTLENPFVVDDTSDFSLSDLDYLELYLGTDNGFPLDLQVTMIMYDSLTHTVSDSILFGKLVEAAPVDPSGRVTEPASGKQMVRIAGEQLDHLETANSLILRVTFNTTDQGSKEVKIYTDYSLVFRLAVATAVDYEFDMGD